MIQKKKILIVEDNELNRAILSGILCSDYQVLEAENGQIALDVLAQYKDNITLILLDVMMPVMDGYTFLDRIRADADLSLIPVIVMTQSDSEEDEVAALTHGATDFVPKPYRPQVILHRVANLIKFRENAAMVNQFQYDRLTGLFSKEFFYRKVRERLDANPDQEYSIICSNIENFKLYNDAFGRKAGDRLLQESAAGLLAEAGADSICGRYNADRFLCLREKEREKMDRDRFFNETNRNFSDKAGNVSVKWGIYEIIDRTISVEQMCDRALLAVNSIRGQYNQPFAVYDDALRSQLLREKDITDAMETALAEQQFVVYFQPKYSLNRNCMAGAEALVRWIHPEWGFLSPGEFIPLFEKNGFITRLDEYIWEQVCARLKEWRERGLPILPVSVNVSRADVYQAHLVDILLELTGKYEVDPSYLHLEITESAYTENPDQIVQTVAELRKMGFIIEMDDFGSGYSSLNMLSRMPLDILKLDMKFIQNEMEKNAEKSILNDIINMAHRMNLNVVAEGVETRDQMNHLRALGCDYVQGYFFAKPMPAMDFENLLKSCKTLPAVSSKKELQNHDKLHRLLVVDEDHRYFEKVCQTFEDQYQVLEASDVQSALTSIRTWGRDGLSAVILSMTLPENGASLLLHTLRLETEFWELPVLATIPMREQLEGLPEALETDDFLCKCHPMFDLRRRVQRLVDVAALRERESILEDEASRDPLTGLLNRRGLQAALSSIRKEEQPLAVYLFDMDNLKIVNDSEGHDTGDRMLRSFAELLRSSTRNEDILCRYGGDEFVVILKRMNNVESVLKKGANICCAFHACLEGMSFTPSCSAGISICGTDENPSDGLIERADRALYRAKQENKGSCCLWTELQEDG